MMRSTAQAEQQRPSRRIIKKPDHHSPPDDDDDDVINDAIKVRAGDNNRLRFVCLFVCLFVSRPSHRFDQG
jgi:hypothetical protein